MEIHFVSHDSWVYSPLHLSTSSSSSSNFFLSLLYPDKEGVWERRSWEFIILSVVIHYLSESKRRRRRGKVTTNKKRLLYNCRTCQLYNCRMCQLYNCRTCQFWFCARKKQHERNYPRIWVTLPLLRPQSTLLLKMFQLCNNKCDSPHIINLNVECSLSMSPKSASLDFHSSKI